MFCLFDTRCDRTFLFYLISLQSWSNFNSLIIQMFYQMWAKSYTVSEIEPCPLITVLTCIITIAEAGNLGSQTWAMFFWSWSHCMSAWLFHQTTTWTVSLSFMQMFYRLHIKLNLHCLNRQNLQSFRIILHLVFMMSNVCSDTKPAFKWCLLAF